MLCAKEKAAIAALNLYNVSYGDLTQVNVTASDYYGVYYTTSMNTNETALICRDVPC